MHKPLLFLAVCLFPFIVVAKDNISLRSSNLYFIENKGQVKDQYLQARTDIQFSIPVDGMTMFIGNGELHYQWRQLDTTGIKDARNKAGSAKIKSSYRMDVELLGANENAIVVTEQKQEYFERYFLNQKDISGTEVHTYKKITYKNIYPHIDWVLYVNGSKVKHEFIVNEGGNPKNIRLQYKGATSLSIREDGSFMAKTPLGTVQEAAPYCYVKPGAEVKSSYVLKDDVLSFDVAPYKGTLVIDPDIIWATYYGGLDHDNVSDIVTDADGNLFGCGRTYGGYNLVTSGAFQTTGGFIGFGGGTVAFLVKFNSAGIRQWATYYGGEVGSQAYDLACDPSGNVYMTGSTASDTLVATPGAFQDTFPSDNIFWSDGMAGYLVKFDNNGARIWGTYFNVENIFTFYTALSDVCTDGNGNVYICGATTNNSIIGTNGAFQPAYTDSGDAFIVKFDPTGQRIWGTYYGGVGHDGLNSITCHDGHIYAAGSTTTSYGITTWGTSQYYYNGENDAFLVKFDTTGNRVWGTYLGGQADDYVNSIDCDHIGNVFVCGNTYSNTGIATIGSFQQNMPGVNQGSGFLSKFTNNGYQIWGTYYGGSMGNATGVQYSPTGYICLTGHTSSDSMIATPASYQDANLNGDNDAYLAQFNQAGTRIWATYFGASDPEYSSAVACSPSGDVYIAGETTSENGIATPGAHQTQYGGNFDLWGDGFIAKFSGCTIPSLQGGGIYGDTIICRNSTQVYTIPPANGAIFYAWERSSMDSTTTDTTFTVSFGNYGDIIKVKAYNDCGVSYDELEVDIKWGNIISQSATTFCGGDSVLLSMSTNTNWNTFQWRKDNVNIPGATDPFYWATTGGIYDAISPGNDCVDTSLGSLTLNAYPLLNPVINYANGQLSTGIFQQYQWYRNGIAVPNEYYQTFNSSPPGYYNVEVWYSLLGCNVISDTFFIYDLSVNSIEQVSNVVLYPNPNNGEFTIKGEGFSDKLVEAEVYDMVGRKVHTEHLEITTGKLDHQMFLGRQLAAGKYILKLQTSAGAINLPFSLVQ